MENPTVWNVQMKLHSLYKSLNPFRSQGSDMQTSFHPLDTNVSS